MKAIFYKNYSLPYTKIKKNPIHATMPAEALTGKPHENWLVLLGHTQFKRKAA